MQMKTNCVAKAGGLHSENTYQFPDYITPAACRALPSKLLVANGVRRLLVKPKSNKKVLSMEKLSSPGGVEAVCPPAL
jgi:hypothetical protein